MKDNIVLIGMPGCGKSTIGKILAYKLKINFYDIDEYIQKKEGKTIDEIFLKGEEHFRAIETLRVKEISLYTHSVISTGGGVIKREENIIALRNTGMIVFINRPLDKILEDIDVSSRPLLKGKREEVYKLYKERLPLYKKYCDYEIDNKGTLEEVINKVVSLFEKV